MKHWYKQKIFKNSEKIAAFVDGELSHQDLGHDPEFSPEIIDSLESVKNLTRDLKSLPQIETSDSFDAVLRDRIRRETTKSSLVFGFQSSPVLRLACYATSAVLFIAFGIYLGQAALSPTPNFMVDGNKSISESISDSPKVKNHYVMEQVVASELENLPRYTISSEGKQKFEQANRDSLPLSQPFGTESERIQQANIVEF